MHDLTGFQRADLVAGVGRGSPTGLGVDGDSDAGNRRGWVERGAERDRSN